MYALMSFLSANLHNSPLQPYFLQEYFFCIGTCHRLCLVHDSFIVLDAQVIACGVSSLEMFEGD